ncbi:amidohydrolase [Colwelliaceae bacterium BS250]
MTDTHSSTQLRKEIHKNPELSNFEVDTAKRIKSYFLDLNPSNIIENIAGTGIAFEYVGSQYCPTKKANAQEQPTLMLRCELDALPIQEINDFEYKSVNDHVSHKCGHDGHMAIISEVGRFLSNNELLNGRVILLFQPAEEIGTGALEVVKDPLFKSIVPDFAFALHNLPGKPLGEVYVKPGVFNFASQGIIINLEGVESHAAHPEDGVSPALALCKIIQCLNDLPQTLGNVDDEYVSVTIISAQMGGANFGTSPGSAKVMATLRTSSNELMARMYTKAKLIINEIANAEKIKSDISTTDVFSTCTNTDVGYDLVTAACKNVKVKCTTINQPYRWSEDFGRLLESAKDGAMFTIGAGVNSPQLHNPDYDFPDELTSIASSVFIELIRKINQFK